MNDNDNVVTFNRKGKGGPPNAPPNFPNPKLPQYTYRFVVVDKLNTEREREFTERGHLIVTQINLALLDENSEIRFSVPNDGSVIYFERIDDEMVESKPLGTEDIRGEE